MVLHNPNNWHWTNKDCSEWAKEWLNTNLTTIKAEKGETRACISGVKSSEGDCDVSQRKGKVITLFDLKVVLDFEGSTGEEKDITGTITIPEVAHDTEEDEYVFEIDLNSASSAKEPVKDLVRSDLLPQLRAQLAKLAGALIQEHGKDLQHAPGQGPPTGYIVKDANKVTSSTAAQANAKASSSTTTTTTSGKGPRINTVSVSTSEEFRTSAEQLFTTFTDPQRLTAFTRSPPTVFEGAKPGGKFALFGGGVTGEYVSLKEPTQIVQKWRLAQWPAGHETPLTITFDEDGTMGVTHMNATFAEVPVGEEETLRDKWAEFFHRALKTTFGFGTIL